MKIISSKDNAIYRQYKKIVENTGLVSFQNGVLIEGKKLIIEAIRAGAQVRALFVVEAVAEEWKDFDEVAYILTESLMKGLSSLSTVSTIINSFTPASVPRSRCMRSRDNAFVVHGT